MVIFCLLFFCCLFVVDVVVVRANSATNIDLKIAIIRQKTVYDNSMKIGTCYMSEEKWKHHTTRVIKETRIDLELNHIRFDTI